MHISLKILLKAQHDTQVDNNEGNNNQLCERFLESIEFFSWKKARVPKAIIRELHFPLQVCSKNSKHWHFLPPLQDSIYFWNPQPYSQSSKIWFYNSVSLFLRYHHCYSIVIAKLISLQYCILLHYHLFLVLLCWCCYNVDQTQGK